MFRLLLNIYTHTAKIHGPFRVNHIGKDRTSCCQYFLVYIYGSESFNRMSRPAC